MMGNDELVRCCVKRPRERIIEMAQLLFRKHGIRGVGVDAIAEEAGTNKMTLYRHFGSKDELIAECLRDTARTADPFWRDLETNHPGDPMAQLHAWVHAVASYASMEAGGCDLIFMASHGRRGVSAFLMGSVTAKVLSHATVPVLVYRS